MKPFIYTFLNFWILINSSTLNGCYCQNYTIDSSFGFNGIILGVGPSSYCSNILVDQNKRILMPGNLPYNKIATRFDEYGKLDSSYKIYFKPYTENARTGPLMVQKDGKILAVVNNYKSNMDDDDYAYCTRLFENGEADSSFLLYEPLQIIVKLLTQNDGSLLYFSSSSRIGNKPFIRAFKSSVDNVIDSSYNLVFEGNFVDAVINPNDDIFVLRHSSNSIILEKFDHKGKIDSTFGNSGKYIFALPGNDLVAQRICLQSNGKMIITGSLLGDFYTLRLNADGTVDESFNNGEALVIDLGNIEAAKDVAILPDGKIAVVGYSKIQGVSNTIVLFIIDQQGTLDRNVGTNGIMKFYIYTGTSDLVNFSNIYHFLIMKNKDILILGDYYFKNSNKTFILKLKNVPEIVRLNQIEGKISASVYPNPSLQKFTVQYQLTNAAFITLSLNDLNGKLVENYIRRELKSSGNYSIEIEAPDQIPKGHYFLVLKANEKIATFPILLE